MSTRKSMVVTVMPPVKALVKKSSISLAWTRIRSTRRSTRRNRYLDLPGKEFKIPELAVMLGRHLTGCAQAGS